MPDDRKQMTEGRGGIGSLIFNLVNRLLYGRPTFRRQRRRDQRRDRPSSLLGDEQQNLYSFYGEKMRIGKSRWELYSEVDTMDSDDLPAATLDTYAEDATAVDPATTRTIWVEDCQDNIRKICDECLERIRMEENAFLIARCLAKYGDVPVELYWEPGQGVQHIRIHHPQQFRRFEELETNLLVGFYLGETAHSASEPNVQPWEVVHFRIFGSMSAMYGTSLLINARRSYRRLRLSEDAAMIYRIQRHPDRDVFNINVTDMTDLEQSEYINRFIAGIRKNRYIDPSTGELREDWNPFTANEDLVLPQVEGRETKVVRLQGSRNAEDVADLEYHLGRYHASVRIPPAHFGYVMRGASAYDPQRKLSHENARYCRIPAKLQHYFMLGVHRILQLNLAFHGISATDKANRFTLAMAPVSYLDELHRQQLIEIRVDIIDRLLNMGQQVGFDRELWVRYVLREYGKVSESLINELLIPGAAAPTEPPTPGGRPTAKPTPAPPMPAAPPEPPAGGAPAGAPPVGPTAPPAELPAEGVLPTGTRGRLDELLNRLSQVEQTLSKVDAGRTRLRYEEAVRFFKGDRLEDDWKDKAPKKPIERSKINVEKVRSDDASDLSPAKKGDECDMTSSAPDSAPGPDSVSPTQSKRSTGSSNQ